MLKRGKEYRSDWQKRITFRILLMSLLISLLYAILIVRVIYLQVIQSSHLTEIYQRQHQGVYRVSPKRGIIYDRNMEELAVSLEVDSLYVHPYKVKDRKKKARVLAKTLNLRYADVLKLLTSTKPFVWIKRKILKDRSKLIRELGWDGFGLITESKRFYPNRELAGHILGFVGTDSVGLEGLELRYDHYLRGEAGYFIVDRDAAGREILTDGIRIKSSVEGYHLVLTIDKNIQYIVERELKKGLMETGGKTGSAVVMEPNTGKILAMATVPGFNPNKFTRLNPSVWRNRVLTDCYEPGSTFKVFLLAAAIEENIAGLDDIFFCENGSFQVADKVITDHKKFGWLSLTDVIKYSSNIGAAKLGKRLGLGRFHHFIRSFGFGTRTGIDLPGEVRGIVRPSSKWTEVCLSNISFGQGISTTLIQMITAFNAIANGGYLIRPYVVERIIDVGGKDFKIFKHKRIQKVISKKTSNIITGILEEVVSPEGTGSRAGVDGFRVGGKTGTAQKVDLRMGGYSTEKFIGSFIGFLPVDDPELTIAVLIDEPKDIVYGGVVAAPIFKRIAEDVLKYMRIFPEETIATNLRDIFEYMGDPDHSFRRNVRIKTVNGKILIPDFQGLTIRQVLRISDRRLDVDIKGSGFATRQSIPPGISVDRGTTIRIWFSPKVVEGL